MWTEAGEATSKKSVDGSERSYVEGTSVETIQERIIGELKTLERERTLKAIRQSELNSCRQRQKSTENDHAGGHEYLERRNCKRDRVIED